MWRRTAFLLLCACGETSAAIANDPADAGAVDAGPNKPTPVDGDEDAGDFDAGADADLCTLERTYEEACGKTELLCGTRQSQDAWCALNDNAINSEQFRAGERKCLTAKLCDTTLRGDCRYKTYASAKQTAAQKALVTAYCSTCEPGNAGCAANAVAYDVVGGPSSITDIFLAGWEFNDAIVDEMRSRCTGGSLDAGAPDGGDAGGACKKAFSTCTGDVYFDHLPDCP